MVIEELKRIIGTRSEIDELFANKINEMIDWINKQPNIEHLSRLLKEKGNWFDGYSQETDTGEASSKPQMNVSSPDVCNHYFFNNVSHAPRCIKCGKLK